MPKYKVIQTSIQEDIYVVEAASEDEARELVVESKAGAPVHTSDDLNYQVSELDKSS